MIRWYVVYTVTNSATQKTYDGVHETDDQYWPRGVDKWRPNVSAVNHDIALYGPQHFIITVNHCAALKEEAQRIYQNILCSHRTAQGRTYNDDVLDNNKGNPNHGGIKHTTETKQKYRSGIRARENNGFYGKQHEPENIEKIREYRKSQRWAVNPLARSEIVLAKDAALPPGYIEGRLCKTEKTIAKQLQKYKVLMGIQ